MRYLTFVLADTKMMSLKRKANTTIDSPTPSNASTTSIGDADAQCTHQHQDKKSKTRPQLSTTAISTKVASSPYKYSVGERGTEVALVHFGYELLLVLRNAGKRSIELTTEQVYTMETYMEAAMEAFEVEGEFNRVIGTDLHFTVGTYNNKKNVVGGIREFYYSYDDGKKLPSNRGVSLNHEELNDIAGLLSQAVENDCPGILGDIMERCESAAPNVTISDIEALKGYMKAGDYTVVNLATGELLLVEKLILLSQYFTGGTSVGTGAPASNGELKQAVIAAIVGTGNESTGRYE